MNILFTRFPFVSAHGGAENQTMWLASGLREQGHEVRFLGSCPILLQAFAAADFGTTKLVIGLPPVTKWTAASFLWRRQNMLSAMIRSIEALPALPDVLVMLSLSEKILLTPWAAEHGINVLWVEHDRIGHWLTKNPWLRELKAASQHATIVCVSELSRETYIEIGFDPERVVSIPNGVPLPPPSTPDPFSHGEKGGTAIGDNEHIPSKQDSLPPSGEGLGMGVGCLARLSPEKGIDVLIHAIAPLSEASLTIVGTGREEAYLRTLIAEDTARVGTERIRLLPRVADLDAFYASLDVFVLPSSDHDPFGLVAAEAMTRGIATVVTDACGIASLLSHQNDALIARAGSAADLTVCLSQLRNSTVRAAIAHAGQQTVQSRCSLEAMTTTYETLMK